MIMLFGNIKFILFYFISNIKYGDQDGPNFSVKYKIVN